MTQRYTRDKMKLTNKIDVHSHYVPEKYRNDCLALGIDKPDGVVGIPTWSEEQHLEMMDKLNISKAYLSITSPGTHLIPGDGKLGRRITRECNVAASQFKRRCPDRIGYFASTPLPDVQGTLDEVQLALAKDGLDADGIAVKTNHHGTYLGDSAFDPVWNLLNEMNAVVFIHPTTPCMANGHAATPLPQYPQPMLEFFFETARAIANLFMTGTVAKYPNITYILSHCGGGFPPMIRRICGAAPILGVDRDLSVDTVKGQLNKQFYFDTAGWSLPEQIVGLLQHASPERILYGTDFPWTPIKVTTELSEDHDRYVPEVLERVKAGSTQDVAWRNAWRLLEERNRPTGIPNPHI